MFRFAGAALAVALLFGLGTSASAGLFGPGPGDFEDVYYQPKVLPSVDEALATFTKLNKYYSSGWSRSRTIVDMQLSSTEMRYKSIRSWVESGYNWVPYNSGAFVGGHYVPIIGGTSEPWAEERFEEDANTIVFSTIRQFGLQHSDGATDETYPWRAAITAKDGENTSTFWFSANDPETPKRLIDAFYTVWSATLRPSAMIYPVLGVDTKSAEDAASTVKRAKVPTGMEGKGVVVAGVEPGSPAAQAGFQPGDVVYRLNRRIVAYRDDGTTTFQRHAASLIGAASRVTVTVKALRAGQEIEMSMTFDNPTPGAEAAPESLTKLGATFKPKAEVAALLAQLIIPSADGPLGAVIDKVTQNSPAALGGVKRGDIVYIVERSNGVYFNVSCAGNTWTNLEDAIGYAAGTDANPTLNLKLVRDGKPIVVPVTVENPNVGLKALRENIANAAKAKAAAEAAANAPKPVRLGVSGRDLAEAEAKGAGFAGGVYVGGVDAGSLAEQMGVKAGDYLVEINGTAIGNTAAMRQALTAGSVTKLKVWRAGKALELSGLEKM